MARMIFVNLPVKDLEKSKSFYQALGFSINPQFTDDKAACVVIEENRIYAMILREEFFKTFIPQTEIADATKQTEVLNALSCESREAVDEMMTRALANGGSEPRPAQDHGWMYNRAFADPDGHIWEIVFMDMSKVPANPGQAS